MDGYNASESNFDVIANISCFNESFSSCDFEFTDDPMCLDNSQDLILECDSSGIYYILYHSWHDYMW